MRDANQKTLVVDVDGTMCPLKRADEHYADLVPHDAMVKALRDWRAEGGYIILYTSRNMRTYHNDIDLIHKNTAPIMLEWLKKWDIPYDEIIFGKPWPGPNGYYIDDRAVRPREFLSLSPEELERTVTNDRLRS